MAKSSAPAIVERNKRIIDLYRHGGMSKKSVAEHLGVSFRIVRHVLEDGRITLSKEEGLRRQRDKLERIRHDPTHRQKHAEAVKRKAPSSWPNCPPHLRDDYVVLKKHGYSTDEAQAIVLRQANTA